MHHPYRDHEWNEDLIHASSGSEIHRFLQLLTFCLSQNALRFQFEGAEERKLSSFFNTEANQNYVGPYPAASFYHPDDMTSSAQAAFYAWYEKQQGVFDFQHEFLAYCISDVDILQRCCAQFRQTIHSLVRVEPFEEAMPSRLSVRPI